MMRLMVVALTFALAAHAAHKPKAPLAPTQADIALHGCLTVSAITYRPFSAWSRGQGVHGTISSRCLKNAQVTVHVSFNAANGTQVQPAYINKLVMAGQSLVFWIEPTADFASIRSGIVTNVFASPIP